MNITSSATIVVNVIQSIKMCIRDRYCIYAIFLNADRLIEVLKMRMIEKRNIFNPVQILPYTQRRSFSKIQV